LDTTLEAATGPQAATAVGTQRLSRGSGVAREEVGLMSNMPVQRGTRIELRLSGRSHPTGKWRHRLLFYHLPLAVLSGVVLILFASLSLVDNGRLSIARLVDSTGYVALALLAISLLIGPANLLLRRRNPVSTYFRRDVGTWTAIVSVFHVLVAFQVHGGGGGGMSSFLDFFFVGGKPLLGSFGLGNWTGLSALVLVVGLLAISTDRSIRELRARRWKNLQRLNYALFGLVVLHAFFYRAFLGARSPLTLPLFFTVIAVLAGQAVGVWLWRRRYSRALVRSA
jgi:methionine sulfoxide reductase heme-binding subunit